MKFVNLTPHDITIFRGETPETIPASGTVARVQMAKSLVGSLNGIPLYSQEFGTVQGIPASEEGTVYIVSAMVLQVTSRLDVVAPDTGSTCKRDQNGNIIGVTRFIC